MAHIAKLVKGETYDVLGHVFKKDIDIEVSKEVADYLKSNDQFEVTEQKSKSKQQIKIEEK